MTRNGLHSASERRRTAAPLTDGAPEEAEAVQVVGGIRRWLFLVAGVAFIGLGAIGVVLPGVPTTPFLLLASYCLVRSSPRLHHWLLRSSTFGPILRNWQTHRALTRRVKLVALVGCSVMIGLSVLFGALPTWARFVVAAVGAYGIYFVARIPTIQDDALGDRTEGRAEG